MDELRDVRERIEDSAFMGMRGGVLYGALSYLLAGGLFVVYAGSALGWVLVALAVTGNVAMLASFGRLLADVRRWVDGTTATDPATARHFRIERKLRGSRGRGGPWPGGSFVFGGMLLPPFGTITAPATALVLAISLTDTHDAGTRWALTAGLVAALVCSLLLVVVPTAFTRQGARLTRFRRRAASR